MKYPCNLCDYQATKQSSLQTHIKSKQKGIKYPCNHCKYQSTQPELHVEKISNNKTIRRNIWVSFTEDLTLTIPQQKLILLLALGCGYEYWVSFWLVGLGSISHISSVPAVVIPLRGSHFSCHRGRAAPYTLNDLSPWRNHQRRCPLPGLIETDFLTSLDLVS